MNITIKNLDCDCEELEFLDGLFTVRATNHQLTFNDIAIKTIDSHVAADQHWRNAELQVIQLQFAGVDIRHDFRPDRQRYCCRHAVVLIVELQVDAEGPAVDIGVATIKSQVIDLVTGALGQVLDIDAGIGNSQPLDGQPGDIAGFLPVRTRAAG